MRMSDWGSDVCSSDRGDGWLRSDPVSILVLLAVALLMISRVPTFAAKRLKLSGPQRLFALVGLVLFIALLISETWIMVSLLTLVYLATIPVSVMQRRRDLRRCETHEPGESVLPDDELTPAGLDHGAEAGGVMSVLLSRRVDGESYSPAHRRMCLDFPCCCH